MNPTALLEKMHRVREEKNWRNVQLNNNVRGNWSSNQPNRWAGKGSEAALEMKVETVDYYSRNDQFSISTHRPPLLNSFAESLPNFSLVNMTVDPSGFSDGPIENNMEALLNYIKAHPRVLENVDFVTNRQILASAAANDTPLDIQAIRRHGRIWIRKLEDSTENVAGDLHFKLMARATAFERELLESEDDVAASESGFSKRNGLFKAFLGADSGQEGARIGILYPGELDALSSSGAHVELKSTLRNDVLKRRGGYYYWQSYLGNVEKIIMGRMYEDTCSSIKTFSMDYLKLKLQQWQWSAFAVNQGARRILKMLQILGKHLKDDGDSVVLSRRTGSGLDHVEDTWTVEVDKKTSEKFEELVEKLFV